MNQPLPLFARAASHDTAVALRSGSEECTYRWLLDRSCSVAQALMVDAEDLDEARIAWLTPSGADYVTAQWATWRAGGVAVPLSLSAAPPEIEYVLEDAQPRGVIATRELAGQIDFICEKLDLPLLIIEEIPDVQKVSLPAISPQRRAMILYTSGTTSRPKGVVTTHANIQAQIETLVEAWEWQPNDCVPLFLPLHHIHGIINVLCCALYSGATVEPFARFDTQVVLDRVATGAYSVFMAVPTIYVKLIQTLESLRADERARRVEGFARMRLMVSGSAALPASVHEKWTALTGQRLLERYGMTEIGMALSNPYHGARKPGMVGQPLPNVDVRLKSEEGTVITGEGAPGEIQVRGPGVFAEYWHRPQVTAESFEEGWFRTGDIAVREADYYRIMGRQSVDIIKSGGYKLSALEIEATLLEHPDIQECAVVGIPDDTWGEAVATAAVLREGTDCTLEDLRAWCRDRLSPYKIPQRLLRVDGLPRNAMGKVTKPAVRTLFDAG